MTATVLLRAPVEGPPFVEPAALRRRLLAVRLSVVLLVAMTLAAVLGLLLAGVYGKPAATDSMLRAFDLVTLAVAVPALAWALRRLPTRSAVAEIVWPAMLAYAAYTSSFSLFGVGFNDLFLLHVLVWSSAVFALPLALSTARPEALIVPARQRAARAVSGVLAVVGLSLGAMWIAGAVRYAADGALPTGSALVESATVVHLAIALDLALLVPGYLVAAVLLWRRSCWGVVAAGVMLVSGAVHQVGYLVALPFQVAADVPGATSFDPAEPVIAAAFFIAAGAVLRLARPASARLWPWPLRRPADDDAVGGGGPAGDGGPVRRRRGGARAGR